MRELRFPCPLADGLHARPATALGLWAGSRAFTWVNERTGREAPFASVLALLATDTRPGDPCLVRPEDAEAETALDDLDIFLSGPFLEGDGAPAPAPETQVPPILRRIPASWWPAQPLVPGLGEGPACFLSPAEPPAPARAQDPEAEARRLQRALDLLAAALQTESERAPAQAAGILRAHAALARDAAWTQAIRRAIREEGWDAPSAVRLATEAACARLAALEQPLLRIRALDLRGLAHRLQELLTPGRPPVDAPEGVLLAEDLTPPAFLALDRSRLRALVLGEGGAASHTAILARAFGIPCVAGPLLPLAPGTPLLVDGRRGLILLDPPPEVAACLRREQEARDLRRARLESRQGPAATRDGVPVRLMANLASAEEAEAARKAGAAGIGLFRTEMGFMGRAQAPTEAEQAAAYRRVVEAAEGMPVTLRLLDAGGDKPLAFLPLPPEANPFLGRRGVRLYAQAAALIRDQVRAALRASAAGPLRILVPMVTDPGELDAVRALVAEAAGDLGLPAPPVGVMVEVPAVALHLRPFAGADFFSVGTNDLLQYLYAEDRGDPALCRPSRAWNPATLRILADAARGAAALGREIGLCGELAGDPRLLPLLLGLGYRTLSAAPGSLPALREALATLDLPACEALAARALEAGTEAEVEALLREAAAGPERPLLDPDLVVLDEACLSKEEAIRLMVERLALAGRAPDPDALEAAVWAREATYSTGIGHGVAVPHGRAPGAGGLVLLRLREPLEWGSLDGGPVRTLLLLASSGAEAHLRVFARLARSLMDPAFREALDRAPDAGAVLALLSTLIPKE